MTNTDVQNRGFSRRMFLKSAALAAGTALVAGLKPAQATACEESGSPEEDVLVLDDGGIRYEITVREEAGVRTVTTVNTSSGNVDSIVYDMNTSTVFSTYTGKTVELAGELALEPEKQLSVVARSRTSYSTKNISYAQIKSVAGTIATAAGLASALLAFVTGATMAANVASLVSAVGAAVNGVASPSTSHGVRVTISTTKYYRNGNHIPYRTVKQITGAALY